MLVFVGEVTGEVRGDRQCAGLLHSAHLHTKMLSLYYHHYSACVKSVLYAMANLGSQLLLYLQTAGIGFDYPCYLAQTRNMSVGQIRHMHFAEEGHEMVLAKGIKLDVFDNHHLFAVGSEESALQYLFRVLPVTFGEKLKGFAYPLGGALQSFAFRIFSYNFQYGFHVGSYLSG